MFVIWSALSPDPDFLVILVQLYYFYILLVSSSAGLFDPGFLDDVLKRNPTGKEAVVRNIFWLRPFQICLYFQILELFSSNSRKVSTASISPGCLFIRKLCSLLVWGEDGELAGFATGLHLDCHPRAERRGSWERAGGHNYTMTDTCSPTIIPVERVHIALTTTDLSVLVVTIPLPINKINRLSSDCICSTWIVSFILEREICTRNKTQPQRIGTYLTGPNCRWCWRSFLIKYWNRIISRVKITMYCCSQNNLTPLIFTCYTCLVNWIQMALSKYWNL